jgi:hypothetical protein
VALVFGGTLAYCLIPSLRSAGPETEPRRRS